jgi:protein-tyrosine kinase
VVNIHEALQKAKAQQQELRRQKGAPEEYEPVEESVEAFAPVGQQEQVGEASELEPVSRVQPQVVSYFDPGSLAAEQFRSIRTALSAMGEDPIRKIVMTSASRGEGKTTITANLGVVLAGDFEQRVLIIDGDLRKPSQARIFGVPSQPGLTDVLSGNIPVNLKELKRSVIRQTEVDRLDLLPSGSSSLNPTELLGSKNMHDLMELLDQEYTRILIDSPPIVAVTDANILGKYVDGAVMVVQAGKTRKEVVSRALSLLQAARTNVLGCVLNGIEYHIPNYIYRYI